MSVPGYGIVKEIATSNFSSVYLARSERLRRNVVLKVMNRGTSARELDDADRFQREYEIISSIAHRAIAEIYDFGALPHHQYLAMEYIPCGDLRDRLRNPLSIDESLYYLRAIAEALRVIHVFGILHRDLKPANVMLREDNSPVLIDFGLARRSMEDASTTGAGQVLGSPYYISPEQSQGQRVDARTDLYSLGVMFYEMLTGQRPYGGRSAMEIMAQHASSPGAPPAAERRDAAGAGRSPHGQAVRMSATARPTSCSRISDRWWRPSPEAARSRAKRPEAACPDDAGGGARSVKCITFTPIGRTICHGSVRPVTPVKPACAPLWHPAEACSSQPSDTSARSRNCSMPATG